MKPFQVFPRSSRSVTVPPFEMPFNALPFGSRNRYTMELSGLRMAEPSQMFPYSSLSLM